MKDSVYKKDHLEISQ